LTRRFDLSNVSQASLRFRLWYDLEPDYDFCFALASREARRWYPLTGQWTTSDDPVGLGLGPGYSGHGGAAAWRDEVVDLSPFAGGEAYVRFECVTDQGFSAAGMALDNISIPEIGFSDDAESDLGWIAEGFVRGANTMAQPALVAIAISHSSGPVVLDVPLESTGRGGLRLSPSSAESRYMLIVAGLAPRTLEQMSYRVWIEAATD
jgi:hypothetical protein